jgi:putative membrane protein
MNTHQLGDTLALCNACLNATSALLILGGRVAIARKNRDAHRRFMVGAFVTSAVFLASYLTRVALTGTHTDPHTGLFHAAYLAVLGTHMILAIAVVPLVLMAFYRAYKGDFVAHKRVVKVTFPVWLYVSVTGVLVYVMLYVVPA